jgi:MYXO-CTERM domain-containing protein
MWRRVFVASLAASILAPALGSSVARADCDNGASYLISVNANTVRVCVTATNRGCASGIDLLRQSEADDSVVVVTGTCSGGCYVDTCVPPGSYRYGYATPYDCSEAGCGGVSFFELAEVNDSLPASCATTDIPTTTAPPWEGPQGGTTQFKVCNGCGCATGQPADRLVVLALDGLVVIAGLAVGRVRRRHRHGSRRRS